MTDAAASSISGPLFGNLAEAATLRVRPALSYLLRSTERFADSGLVHYGLTLRADVGGRDVHALVGVQYQATLFLGPSGRDAPLSRYGFASVRPPNLAPFSYSRWSFSGAPSVNWKLLIGATVEGSCQFTLTS